MGGMIPVEWVSWLCVGHVNFEVIISNNGIGQCIQVLEGSL